ncbi:hypothetical protein C8R44DRAFT_738088 [Mycena epipterygia]|nr:hypothetical protein C8R44DRAFT_738088 [Mycena epipterygia]
MTAMILRIIRNQQVVPTSSVCEKPALREEAAGRTARAAWMCARPSRGGPARARATRAADQWAVQEPPQRPTRPANVLAAALVNQLRKRLQRVRGTSRAKGLATETLALESEGAEEYPAHEERRCESWVGSCMVNKWIEIVYSEHPETRAGCQHSAAPRTSAQNRPHAWSRRSVAAGGLEGKRDASRLDDAEGKQRTGLH